MEPDIVVPKLGVISRQNLTVCVLLLDLVIVVAFVFYMMATDALIRKE